MLVGLMGKKQCKGTEKTSYFIERIVSLAN